MLTYWTREVLASVRAGHYDLAAVKAAHVADEGTLLDLVAVCRVLADTALRALTEVFGEPDPDDEVWILDQIDEDHAGPHWMFAARVVTAHANQDSDMVTALVAAAAHATHRERAEALLALVTYASQLDAYVAHHKPTTHLEGHDT